jgi:hypothetical protein
MKKRIFACAMTVLLLAITSWADDKEKDEDRLDSEYSRRHSQDLLLQFTHPIAKSNMQIRRVLSELV